MHNWLDNASVVKLLHLRDDSIGTILFPEQLQSPF